MKKEENAINLNSLIASSYKYFRNIFESLPKGIERHWKISEEPKAPSKTTNQFKLARKWWKSKDLYHSKPKPMERIHFS